jgi:hypothetical protein
MIRLSVIIKLKEGAVSEAGSSKGPIDESLQNDDANVMFPSLKVLE